MQIVFSHGTLQITLLSLGNATGSAAKSTPGYLVISIRVQVAWGLRADELNATLRSFPRQ